MYVLYECREREREKLRELTRRMSYKRLHFFELLTAFRELWGSYDYIFLAALVRRLTRDSWNEKKANFIAGRLGLSRLLLLLFRFEGELEIFISFVSL